MKKFSNRTDYLIASALSLATFAALWRTEAEVGYVRDESVYFAAGQSYANWFKLLILNPRYAITDPAIVRCFDINHEHPALMKILFGLSHLLFHQTLGWLAPGTAFRFPAFAVAAIIPFFLFIWGDQLYSRTTGLFAAFSFFLIPRQFFNAHLACFDVPIAALWLVTTYAFWKSQTAPKYAVACGFAFGLAIAIKHNALFLPFFLVPFALWNTWKQQSTKPLLPLLAMGVFAPVFFYLHWPYLWHHPIERIAWYLNFHTHHEHYPWFYLGKLLREPPFPLAYVFVKTALTVPVALLVPMVLGLLALAFRIGSRLHPLTWTDALLGVHALASILIISHPQVPHFGGVKHWLPSMTFLALLAASRVDLACQNLSTLIRAQALMRPWVSLAFCSLLLVSPLIALCRVHPYGTSYYNEVAGGLPGAASLGMQRQFWSNNVTGVMDWINQHASRGARVYLHEVTGYAFRDYQLNGQLRSDLISASGPNDASIVAYQYHQEFREQEFNIWQAFGTQIPAYGLYLDETPQVVVYQRSPTR